MAIIEDIRYGLRTMARNPGFSAIAVIALALGIGANATVFAITNTALFKNMPFVSDRIVYLSTHSAQQARFTLGVSYPDFRDWSTQSKSFDGMALYTSQSENVSDKGAAPDRYQTSDVSPNMFSLIGQQPVLGRDFLAADAQPGSAAVAILGDRIWTERYGRNPAVLGSIIRVNSIPTTVVGVMRPGFRFPNDTDLWTALVPGADAEKRDARNIGAIGKLAPGATQASATVELNSIAHNLEVAYPDTNKGITARVQTFQEIELDSDTKSLLGALMGAVLFVLLIACANVANMLLSRAVGRSREISIRIALGAGRWRVIRQLLIESAMLSIAGGALGWLIAQWGLHVFAATVRSQVPQWMDFSMDFRGLAYLAAISIGTGLLFGLAPALRLSKLDVNSSLKAGGRGSSGASRGKFLSSVLVVGEMALAVVLLAGAGLMMRSFMNVVHARTGVNEKNVLVMRLELPPQKYPKPEDQIAFHDRLKARLEALPGVAVSCIAVTMPTGGSFDLPYEIEGRPRDPKQDVPNTVIMISPDYFRTMDVKLLRGRAFVDSDTATGPGVAIVNQKFVEALWPGDDPIGKRLRIFQNRDKTPTGWLTVVGVAPNILQNDVSSHKFDPLIYVPYRQMTRADMALMARTTVPPASLAAAFRNEVKALDEDMPLFNLRTLEERLATNQWDQIVFSSLFGIFAGIALLLASIGLYAVIAHSVSQRTQEIGVRMALGARAANILTLVLRQGLVQLAIGLAIGIAGAFATTRLIASELQGVSPTDPSTFALTAAVLGAAAMLGCLIPARRAMTVDPVIALRNE
jgi:putative ABC transport system permease protein